MRKQEARGHGHEQNYYASSGISATPRSIPRGIFGCVACWCWPTAGSVLVGAALYVGCFAGWRMVGGLGIIVYCVCVGKNFNGARKPQLRKLISYICACVREREAHGKAQKEEFQRTHGQTTRRIFRQIFVFCVRALCIEIQKGGYSSREINGRATQQRPRSWIDQQRASRCIGHCRLKLPLRTPAPNRAVHAFSPSSRTLHRLLTPLHSCPARAARAGASSSPVPQSAPASAGDWSGPLPVPW